MPTELNRRVAGLLRECGELLRQQRANPFRINAYSRAARTLESLDRDVRDILDAEGLEGLIRLPSIGRGLASSIDEILRTGRLSQLDRLRGEADPEALFQSVPGIGPTLARDLHDRLHIDTLEGLEEAAHDGRLETVPGIGTRRAAAIRFGLASLLGQNLRPAFRPNGPSVGDLLAVDREYREKSAADRLPKLAPKRFNPEGKAWLPILHTQRGKWHFTALFSNTARAHELGRTDDWLVVYFYDQDHAEGQHTIVTETGGPMKGLRVVRGREAECKVFYDKQVAEIA